MKHGTRPHAERRQVLRQAGGSARVFALQFAHSALQSRLAVGRRSGLVQDQVRCIFCGPEFRAIAGKEPGAVCEAAVHCPHRVCVLVLASSAMPPPYPYSDTVQAMRAWVRALGRLPCESDWEHAANGRPCARTVRRRWGWYELTAEPAQRCGLHDVR